MPLPQVAYEVAEGDGPVNALDAALRKALNGAYPGLNEMRLVDYKVRVVNAKIVPGEEFWRNWQSYPPLRRRTRCCRQASLIRMPSPG